MPADEDWVLIANQVDASLLRNFVAYSTSRWLGRYASRTRLVGVVVNRRYDGVYLLPNSSRSTRTGLWSTTAISRALPAADNQLSQNGSRAAARRILHDSAPNRPVLFSDPDRDDLSQGRARSIRDYVSRFDRSLYGEDFRYRRRGYCRYLDMDAAVDYMLLSELFRHDNTFKDSTYTHKDVGGKLVLGPIWDLDNAIGHNGVAEFNLRRGWSYGAYPWAGRLYADPAFRRRMATRWKELRRRGLRRPNADDRSRRPEAHRRS
jgi:hypothetical protein